MTNTGRTRRDAPSESPRAWWWLWGPVAAQMGAIFVLSSQPTLPTLPGGLTNHTGHFVGYAALGALLLRAIARASWRQVTTRAAAWSWLVAVAYGASDELHQRFVPGRMSTLDDWVADAAGAWVAVSLGWLWARRRQRTRKV